ncbi:c-type cytochrome biogenesis protein CcmI [uncultured Maricaulis sp.]|uniref:c-type cytochrome biogenesis protein CcmI n=1 Tax=uncultured Maricaulis sp. TaxID=174710 RepID=UPI0030D77C8E|tara:strand:+ start:124651 stop:125481 length:831 start_codon:yes stop_codon:yes gene_type:complete
MLWILIAVMASLTVAALVLPFMRRKTETEDDGLGAFAGQLEELKRDGELGLIAPDEVRAAEIDIKRRLLAASGQADTEERPSPLLRQVAIIACGLGGMAAVAIYMMVGTPQPLVADEPAPVEVSAEMRDVLDQVEALAAQMAANPGDAQGWAVLGQAYLSLGRYSEAANAFDQAINIVPDSAFLFASLGQALLFDANGTMTPAAREAFARALDVDPTDVRARFFMAEALYQSGETEAAIAAWQALLAGAPPDAAYRGMIEARLAALTPQAETHEPE